MNPRYFKVFPGIIEENLKQQYRDLCKKLHPDKGGSKEKFSEMKQEYNKLLEMLQNNEFQVKENGNELSDLVDKLINKVTNIPLDYRKPVSDLVKTLLRDFIKK